MRKAILLTVALLGACQSGPPEGVEWADPAGDTPQQEGWLGLDIIHVNAVGYDEQLHVTFTLPFPVQDFYKQYAPDGKKRGRVLADLLIDADSDPATGGHPAGMPKRTGYEFVLSAQLGYWAKSKETGMVSLGPITFDPAHTVYKFRPTFELRRFTGKGYPVPVEPGIHVGVKSFSELTRIDGSRIHLLIPYKLLAVEKGHKLRLSYREAAAGAAPRAYSEHRTLELR
jgi:hypothetical protein